MEINLPNKLTIFRIMIVPIVVLLLSLDNLEYKYLYSGIFFLIASYTDHLDGQIARKNNIVTDFGKIMDPLADKILVSSIFICFVGLGLVPSLAAAIIVVREFIVTSLRFLVLQGKGKVISANILGKLKTFTQIVSIMSIFVIQTYLDFSAKNNFAWTINQNALYIFKDVLIWASVLFSCLSGASYIFLNRKFIVFSA